MLSVKILYDVPQWAHFQVSEALRKYAPADVRVSTAQWLLTRRDELDDTLGPEAPDVILINQFRHARMIRDHVRDKGWRSRIACFWNVGWPRRVDSLASVLTAADGVIFINDEYRRHVGDLPQSTCIPHGVDLDVFRVAVPVAERPRRVLWLGSEVNREIKGYDRIIRPLERRLLDLGFECDFRLCESNDGGADDAEHMADWYNSGRIILCASESEGTPNVALEAAACGCVPVTTRVGNMPELVRHGENGMFADGDVDAFVDAVCAADERYEAMSATMLDDIRAWGWDVLAPKVFDYLRAIASHDRFVPRPAPGRRRSRVISQRVAGRADGPDFSDALTVFVTTVGAHTYQGCLSLVHEQDCRFRLVILQNIAPMSAAFQKMLELCETEFYVQVDEDMLLHGDAVRRLYETMRDKPPETAIHVERLFDTHARINIYGVKIFRHAICRRYPFRDLEGCDVDQNTRLMADGFEVSLGGLTGANERPDLTSFGLHGTYWSASDAFYRYRKLAHIAGGRKRYIIWSELTPMMVARVAEEASEANVFALLGAMAGQIEPTLEDRSEADFRNRGRSSAFQAVRQFYDRVSGEGRGT
jgi:hypothetical protein